MATKAKAAEAAEAAAVLAEAAEAGAEAARKVARAGAFREGRKKAAEQQVRGRGREG